MVTLFPSRKNIIALAAALLVLSFALTARAQEAVWELEPTQSQVNFTLGDVLHTVHGTFRVNHGTVRFNPFTGHASGLVVVDAASGDSGSHARDHRMNNGILESPQYPEITFAPEHVEGQVLPQGDFNVRVRGTFTLHGASHPLTLSVQAHVSGLQMTADSQFTVPYVNWGLKDPSTLFLRVSDTVDIALHAVGAVKLGLIQ
jgi:polyisoprenoid-binding protein YceI